MIVRKGIRALMFEVLTMLLARTAVMKAELSCMVDRMIRLKTMYFLYDGR